MTILLLFSAVLLGIALYCALAHILHIPPFSVSTNIRKRLHKETKKTESFTFLSGIYIPLAKIVPLGLSKEIELERILERAGSKYTPKQFTARMFMVFLFTSLASIPFFMIGGLFGIIIGIILIAVAMLVADMDYDKVKKIATAQQQDIEREIPAFVETFSYSIKTDRNIERIIESYTENYTGVLVDELRRTLVDMRTGSQEKALLRLERRLNNALAAQLIRGIVASIHGDDMQVFFDELTLKAEEFRKHRMTMMVQKIKVKIDRFSSLNGGIILGVMGFFGVIILYNMIRTM